MPVSLTAPLKATVPLLRLATETEWVPLEVVIEFHDRDVAASRSTERDAAAGGARDRAGHTRANGRGGDARAADPGSARCRDVDTLDVDTVRELDPSTGAAFWMIGFRPSCGDQALAVDGQTLRLPPQDLARLERQATPVRAGGSRGRGSRPLASEFAGATTAPFRLLRVLKGELDRPSPAPACAVHVPNEEVVDVDGDRPGRLQRPVGDVVGEGVVLVLVPDARE